MAEQSRNSFIIAFYVEMNKELPQWTTCMLIYTPGNSKIQGNPILKQHEVR